MDAGQLFLAELLTLYPDRDLYFLARDGEYFYDLARVLLKDDPESLSRIKLINASRKALMRPEELGAYLRQEGLSLEALRSQSAVLVDTGVLGTLPDGISALLDGIPLDSLRSHFLLSGNLGIPQSRIFLYRYRPGFGYRVGLGGSLSSYEGPIMRGIENYLHYTGPFDHHELEDGRWVGRPSDMDVIEDGKKGFLQRVKPEASARAIEVMKAVKWYGSERENVENFKALRMSLGEIFRAATTGKSSGTQLARAVQRVSTETASAFVTDILDAAQKRNIRLGNAEWVAFLKQLPDEVQPRPDLIAYVAGAVPEPSLVLDASRVSVPKAITGEVASLVYAQKDRAIEIARGGNPETAAMLVLKVGESAWLNDFDVVSEIIRSESVRDSTVQHLITHYLLSYPEVPTAILERFLSRFPTPPSVFSNRISRAPHWLETSAAGEYLLKSARDPERSSFAKVLLQNGYWARRPEGMSALLTLIRASKVRDYSIANSILSNNKRWQARFATGGMTMVGFPLFDILQKWKKPNCTALMSKAFPEN